MDDVVDADASSYWFPLALAVPLLGLLYVAIPLLRSASSPSDGGGGAGGGRRLPPGPWQLPVIGSLHHLIGALPHRALQRLSRRHGPLMLLKLGQVEVLVASSADAAREIMKTQDHALCSRPMSSCAKVLHERGHGITFAPHGDHWRQMRRVGMHSLLNAKCISSFQRVREEDALRFMRYISEESASSSQQVNLSRMLAAHVTATTVHYIMGRHFKEHHTLLRYVDDAVQMIGRFTVSDMFPSWTLLTKLSGRLRRAAVFRDSLLVFMERVIGEHIERRSTDDKDTGDDVIDVLLRTQREGNFQFPFTMDNVKAVLFEFLAGGGEAPITMLQWAMAELMRNPSVMSRAQAEVRGAFTGQMKVTEEGLGQLAYLECIIKETLRLHVPGPLLLPRECQEQCTILGYDVPTGAVLAINAWAISRDPQYWDEPEAFVPDRFVGIAIDYRDNNFEYTPFGGGRRICPGMLFGLTNIKLALASLLFYFDWALPHGLLPGALDMTESWGITARRKEDLMVRATLRVQLPCGSAEP